jgi:membrane protein YqaA with SNARE-associated domain
MKPFLDQLAHALVAFGPWGVFVLALVDSLGVPMPAIMDALVIGAGAASAKNPAYAYFLAAMAVLGSVAGNVGLFLAARQGSRLFQKKDPPTARRQRLRGWFDRYGLLTVFIPAITPVLPLPMKVFVISAGVMRTSLWRFTGIVLFARVVRYFGEAYLGLQLGADAHGFLVRNGWTLAGAAAGMAAALYLLIRLSERRSQAA